MRRRRSSGVPGTLNGPGQPGVPRAGPLEPKISWPPWMRTQGCRPGRAPWLRRGGAAAPTVNGRP
eukprot:4812614-Lingulodinium_polyedra.AAC.1